MAPLLNERHRKERDHSKRKRRELDRQPDTIVVSATVPGGDRQYRIPTIGLNPGAIPGTNPGSNIR